MSEHFDPYHKWLGIPLRDQPPSHYRLLGIEVFESDPQVIEFAADRQMKHVRTFRGPQDVLHSQRLLNELAAARVCLLNPEKKELYDQELRARLFDADVDVTGVAPEPVWTRPRILIAVTAAAMLLIILGGFAASLLLPKSSPTIIVKVPPEAVPEVQPSVVPTEDVPPEAVRTPPEKLPPGTPKTESTNTVPERRPRPKKTKKEDRTNPRPAVPTRTVPPPAPPETPEPIEGLPVLANTIDLLKQFRDSDSGSEFVWQIGSEVTPDATASVDIKTILEIATGSQDSSDKTSDKDYLLTLDVERALGTGPLLVGLVVNENQTVAVIGDQSGQQGLDQVDGVSWNENGTGRHKENVLPEGTRALLRLLVMGGRVYVLSGNEPLIDWAGNTETLSVRKDWRVFNKQSLFIGATGSLFRIRRLDWAPVVVPMPEPGKTSEPIAKLPIPSKEEQELGEQTLQQDHRSEILVARKPEQKIQLARKLLGLGQRPDAEPGYRYRILMRSLSLATEAGSATHALDALDALDELFEIELLNRKAEVITDLGKNARQPDSSRQVAQVALSTLDEAIVVDSYHIAENLGKVANSAARIAKDAELLQLSQTRTREAARLGRLYGALAEMIVALENDPEDADANLAIGKFQCFEKEAWESGLPHLARGSEQELRVLATRDLEDSDDTMTQLELADSWWQLASKERGDAKAPLAHRAQHWFLRALPSLAGPKLTDIRSRLREIPGFRPVPGCLLRYSFESSTFLPQGRETIVGDLSGLGNHGRIDSLRVLPGKVGTSLRLQRANSLRVNGLFPAKQQPRTIMFWVQCDEMRTDDTIHVLDCGSDECGFQIEDGVWQFQGGPELVLKTNARSDVEDDWHHHAVTYDGTTVCYYVDGEMIAEQSMPLSNPRNELVFGPAKGLRARFSGTLDEFAVFNRALSAEELLDIVYLGLWDPAR